MNATGFAIAAEHTQNVSNPFVTYLFFLDKLMKTSKTGLIRFVCRFRIRD